MERSCTCTNPPFVVKRLRCGVNEGNRTRWEKERVIIETLSDSLRNDERPIMREFLQRARALKMG